MGNECPHCSRQARELVEEQRIWNAILNSWERDQRTLNVDSRTGHTVAQGRRARRRFREAVRQIVNLLRLRRRWARLGNYLQNPNIRDLTVGLERRRGTLVRTRPAPTRR